MHRAQEQEPVAQNRDVRILLPMLVPERKKAPAGLLLQPLAIFEQRAFPARQSAQWTAHKPQTNELSILDTRGTGVNYS